MFAPKVGIADIRSHATFQLGTHRFLPKHIRDEAARSSRSVVDRFGSKRLLPSARMGGWQLPCWSLPSKPWLLAFRRKELRRQPFPVFDSVVQLIQSSTPDSTFFFFFPLLFSSLPSGEGCREGRGRPAPRFCAELVRPLAILPSGAGPSLRALIHRGGAISLAPTFRSYCRAPLTIPRAFRTGTALCQAPTGNAFFPDSPQRLTHRRTVF